MILYTCVPQADDGSVRSKFQKRVKKIAFTDSVHSFDLQKTTSGTRRWMTTVSHRHQSRFSRSLNPGSRSDQANPGTCERSNSDPKPD